MACMNFEFIYLLHFIKNTWVGSLFIKSGLSPLYDIEMLIKFCVFLDFPSKRESLAEKNFFGVKNLKTLNLFQSILGQQCEWRSQGERWGCTLALFIFTS